MKHLKSAHFSKPQLLIFAIAFALIGYLIFRSLAAPNPSLPGDLNNDNTVNITDLSILLSDYNTTNTAADINSDGTVNVLDLSILLSHYGESVSPLSSCSASTASWQNLTLASQTGTFTATYYMVPSAQGLDAVTGFSNGPATDYTNLAPIIRFNPTNTFDARDGAVYAAMNTLGYTTGQQYLVKLDINVTNRTYNAYVTPQGGAAVQIASNYAFRTEQASVSSLNNLDFIAAVGAFQVCDLQITNSVQGGGGGGSTRIYTADFSAGDFSQVDSLQESSPGRISLVSPGLAGNKYAAKIICGPQDTGVAGSSGNQRTELDVQSFSPHLGGGSLEGKDVWVAWTFKLASPFTPPTNWRDYGQFHAGVGSPSFAFQAHSDGSFWIEQRGGTYVNGSGNYKTMELTPSVAPDVEHTVVVFRHWSTTTSGITKVWYDRDPSQAPNVSLSGPTLEIGYESAPYMKYGMYGQSNVADNTVYVSNIRWATTAAGL